MTTDFLGHWAAASSENADLVSQEMLITEITEAMFSDQFHAVQESWYMRWEHLYSTGHRHPVERNGPGGVTGGASA